MQAALYPDPAATVLIDAVSGAGLTPVPVADAASLAEQEPPDGWAALVVDLGGEPETRLALARRVAEAGGPPVLLVVPRSTMELAAGTDAADFVLSPIDPDEVALRLRRIAGTETGSEEGPGQITFKDLVLDLATYQARVGGRSLDLTYMEYELLAFFAGHSARVWTREQLLARVWGYDYFGGARTVDVHVRRLRAKLGEERAGWITTVRSVGYRFG